MKHLFFCTTLLALFLLAGCADSATPPQTAPSIAPAVTHTPTPSPTPMLRPMLIPTQKSVPTQAPVQQLVKQQPATQLFVTITSASATDYSSGSVSAHTLPGTALTIEVTYCTGHNATSGSLQGTEYANSAGNYT